MRCCNWSNGACTTKACVSAAVPDPHQTSGDCPLVGGSYRPGRCSLRQLVLYTRYSSDMQRADSCDDQERNIRAGLDRLGIDHCDALVLRDEAESGTKLSRDGFARLTHLVQTD